MNSSSMQDSREVNLKLESGYWILASTIPVGQKTTLAQTLSSSFRYRISSISCPQRAGLEAQSCWRANVR